MLATHRDAEERYTVIRQAVIYELNREFRSGWPPGLRATLIDSPALSESELWKDLPRRKVDWDWKRGYQSFKFRYPKRFELALWENHQLASLSLGRPTYNGSSLRLDFLEASPEKRSGLKVFEPTFLAMVSYATALGANELRVMNPINAEVKAYYEKFGFTYVAESDYLNIRL